MFDQAKADLWVNFFAEYLTHTKGVFARKPFTLPPWQRKIVSDIFGTVKADGLRQYSTAYVEVPKKNGKSEIAAGIAIGGLVIDDEPGAEIYSAAATRDQASLVFRVAAQMVRNNEELSDILKVVDSTKTIYKRDEPSTFYKAISADAGTQDGINPHIVIYDELHRQRSRDLWDVLKLGSDTRMQPLLFAITTAGISGESPICWEQHEYARQILEGVFNDPSFYACIYAIGQDEDWTFEGEPEKDGKPATGWYRANPALGDFLRIEKVREAAEKAKRIPSEQNSFRRLRCNQWVAQETRWINVNDWKPCGIPTFDPEKLKRKECVLGLDLSTTNDITALIKLFPEDSFVYVLPEFFLPEDGLHDRSIRDNVPYEFWANQGLIHLTQGNLIDYSFVRHRIQKIADEYSVREVAADPWNAAQLLTELTNDGLTVVHVRQGFATLSAPSKELERLVLSQKLRHNGNPVLEWMADCTSIKSDPAGNIKPVKPDRKASNKRIDGIVALVTGLARLIVSDGGGDMTYRGLRVIN